MSKRFEFTSASEATTFATALATALGPEWVVEPIEDRLHWIELRSPAAGIIALSTQYGDDKLRISGRFPHHSQVQSPHGHCIGVSPTRPATVIAAEIKRRLLPNYLAAREEYLGRVQAFETGAARDLVIARELAAISGARLDRTQGTPSTEVPQFYTKGYSARVTVSHGSVSLDRISTLNPKVAAKVLKALAAGKEG